RRSCACELHEWKHFVQGAAPVAVYVEQHTAEARGENGLGPGPGVRHGALQVLRDQLEPCDVTMMPDAELAEAESAQVVLRALHHGQALTRDGEPVRQARGETRRCRLVPGRETERMREHADVLLRESCLLDWRANAVLERGLCTGPVVARVVGVRAIDNRSNAVFIRDRAQPPPQLALAEVAAVRRVRRIARVVQLVRVDLDVRNAEVARALACDVELKPRHGRAAAGDGQHALRPECPDRRDRQEDGVDAARIADADRSQLSQDLLQPRVAGTRFTRELCHLPLLRPSYRDLLRPTSRRYPATCPDVGHAEPAPSPPPLTWGPCAA